MPYEVIGGRGIFVWNVLPELDPAVWREVSREPLERGPRDEFAAELVILERASGPASC